MHTVLERTRIVPNIHLLQIEAPEVARKVVPGNFVILKIDQVAERIPLTVADWDRETGVISIVFMTVGASTHRLAKLEPGDQVEACVGPLGRGIEIENFGTVAIMVGCYGIGAAMPVARAMKEAGNSVIAIIEARAQELIYWDDKYREIADRLFLTTFGASGGGGGRVSDVLEELLHKDERIDRVVAMGCTFMMKKTAETTRPKAVKTIVSLNPVMIDGTGMCGVCRCTVGGKRRFACVDGPDFDGHQVDWQELTFRRRSYLDEEVRALSDWECRTY